jgi:DNA-binding Lrp family transcriptional regulator
MEDAGEKPGRMTAPASSDHDRRNGRPGQRPSSASPGTDRLDAQVIGALTGGSRPGVVELARELGVARNTVQYRIRRLEETGIIRGYGPSIDLEALGAPTQAFIGLEVEQGRFPAVALELGRIPEVLEVHVTTGRQDLLVRVATIGPGELQRVLQRIYAVPGVAHSETTLTLSVALPYRVQPLIDSLSRNGGFGRATPPA